MSIDLAVGQPLLNVVITVITLLTTLGFMAILFLGATEEASPNEDAWLEETLEYERQLLESPRKKR